MNIIDDIKEMINNLNKKSKETLLEELYSEQGDNIKVSCIKPTPKGEFYAVYGADGKAMFLITKKVYENL